MKGDFWLSSCDWDLMPMNESKTGFIKISKIWIRCSEWYNSSIDRPWSEDQHSKQGFVRTAVHGGINESELLLIQVVWVVFFCLFEGQMCEESIKKCVYFALQSLACPANYWQYIKYSALVLHVRHITLYFHTVVKYQSNLPADDHILSPGAHLRILLEQVGWKYQELSRSQPTNQNIISVSRGVSVKMITKGKVWRHYELVCGQVESQAQWYREE